MLIFFLIAFICYYLPFTQQVYTPEFLEKIPSVDFCLADATRSQIFYYLFKSDSQKTAIVLNEDYVFSEEDKAIPMKILMHGFTSNVTSPWYKEMKREYFKKGKHNIVYIDWSIAANKSFAISSANIKPVGEYIADFIAKIRVPLENIHLIGHSLGSHLAGFIGKNLYSKTGKKVSRITATDAGGPGFERVGPEARLCKYDADFVDVIHTDSGYYGITKPIGHADFYVNGGRFQPGCPNRKIDDNCSHARSNDYFIESINSDKGIAQTAKFDEGEIVLEADAEKVRFGDGVPTTVRGIFYVKTNSIPPFFVLKNVK